MMKRPEWFIFSLPGHSGQLILIFFSFFLYCLDCSKRKWLKPKSIFEIPQLPLFNPKLFTIHYFFQINCVCFYNRDTWSKIKCLSFKKKSNRTDESKCWPRLPSTGSNIILHITVQKVMWWYLCCFRPTWHAPFWKGKALIK